MFDLSFTEPMGKFRGYAAALANGGRDNRPVRMRECYLLGCDAAYVLDSDGNTVEAA